MVSIHDSAAGPPEGAALRRLAPRHTKDERCYSLIKAAIRALGRYGSANISVRHIAAEAGVSAGLVTHHFGGVENLLAEATMDLGELMLRQLDHRTDAAGPEAHERLEAHVAAWFHPTLLEKTTLLALLAIEGLVPTMPAVAAAHSDLSSKTRTRIANLLEACFPDADHGLSAASLMAIIKGLRMGLVHENGGDREFALQCVVRTWVPALHAAATKRPQESVSVRQRPAIAC